eukprot:scaffold271901_cov142-Cyclotella_meneghiniana.AAC.2
MAFPQHGHVSSCPMYFFWTPIFSHPYIIFDIRMDWWSFSRFFALPRALQFIVSICSSVHLNLFLIYVLIWGTCAAYCICSFISVVTMLVPRYRVAPAPSIGLGLLVGFMHFRIHSFAEISHAMFNLTGNGRSSNGVSSSSS